MARLLVQMEGMESRPINLRFGVNCIGRNSECDFQLDHFTVSSRHCELILTAEGVLIRDCDSTNGTFVDGQPIKVAQLLPGQTVHLGDVKLFVENAEVTIAIPQMQKPAAVLVGVGSPVVMPNGAVICSRHSQALATYQCTECNDVMCTKCVRSMKRHGGQAIHLCVVCGQKCLRINSEPPKKKTFLDTLRRTVKMPFEVLSGRMASRK